MLLSVVTIKRELLVIHYAARELKMLRRIRCSGEMCLGNPKVYWNDQESNGLLIEVRLVQEHEDKTVSTMSRQPHMMYPVHAVLLSFSTEFRRNHIYNVFIFGWFLPVGYENNYSIVQGIDELEWNWNTTMSEHRNWCVWEIPLPRPQFLKIV